MFYLFGLNPESPKSRLYKKTETQPQCCNVYIRTLKPISSLDALEQLFMLLFKNLWSLFQFMQTLITLITKIDKIILLMLYFVTILLHLKIMVCKNPVTVQWLWLVGKNLKSTCLDFVTLKILLIYLKKLIIV